jgi:serine/threonine-protein kinase
MRYPNEATFCFVDGTALSPLDDPRIGKTIAGRYEILEVLGEGGMSTVYRAKHRFIDEQYAVKVMNPALACDPTVRERFRREAKNAQKLAHPNIIEIFEQGDTEDGTAYMVMELLEGQSLAELIAQGPMDIKRAIGLMIQMGRGIARAHDLEVIHRDLKPENIFVCKRGDGTDLVKLLDFGIARSMHDSRLTGTGELFGTPQYMAPERITTMDAGPSADLYAMGVLFFEMTTGRLPFDAPDVTSFFVKHLKEAPLPIRRLRSDIPESLADLIEQLMAKDPAARPVDAHRMTLDLVHTAREIGAPIPPEPVSDPASSRAPPTPISDLGIHRWQRRVEVFEQMLSRGYGSDPPADVKKLMQKLVEGAARITKLREQSVQEQRNLERIDLRGRDGRQRFGLAVDALGADAMRAREELRSARDALRVKQLKVELVKERLLEQHKEVLRWEGRSAFQEPYDNLESVYLELAKAYRGAAEVVDAWLAACRDEQTAQKRCEAAETTVRDLEYQIGQLREALIQHESDIEAERAASEQAITEMTREVDRLEDELLGLATTFCEPLREKPELGPLFQALEAA